MAAAWHQFCLKIMMLLWLAGMSGAAAADSLDLPQYRGKIVLVDFWASWCAPCRHSFPWLDEMQAKYADRGLVVVGVNVDPVRSDADRFLRNVPVQFRIVYDPTGALASQYNVPGMPTSFIFGTDGKLIAQHIGFQLAARSDREKELQRLLPAHATGRPE